MCRCRLLIVVCLLALASPLRGAPPSTRPADAGAVAFEEQTLANGLRVIYAPLRTAPVVHVRVLYHVGSRDERPDRQGFAHMFEHMMFRGSAHVKPEEHMKLVGGVGGTSNAFTSFDQTVYFQTLPASHLEMALYLEADRMASFKVSEDIYKTERKVVAEEWRMRQNRPYGNLYDELMKAVFTAHSYRWTPIGNMDHLRAAPVNELQEFFNTYYLPNNAVLVVAGDFDVPAAKSMVEKYFGWIPRGPDVVRAIPAEPEQTEARRTVSPQRVPLPAVMVGFKLPPYEHPDQDAIGLLASILGDGGSSRLDRRLVNNDAPLAVDAYANTMPLQDGGVLTVGATVLQGKDAADVEAAVKAVIDEAQRDGITRDELAKAKTQARVGLLRGRETAEAVASQLGSEALFAGDPARVNTELARLDRVTVADVNRVAQQYLDPSRGTTLVVKPDPLGTAARASATQAASIAEAGVAPSTAPVRPRDVAFPAGYAERPPGADIPAGRAFEKGTEFDVRGVRVVVMPDRRLPLVTWSLTLRQGGHAEPTDKAGLAGLTAALVERGTKSTPYPELSRDLESRGISLDVSDGGDVTRVTGSSTTDQLAHGILRTHETLTEPRMDPAEFAKLKDQAQSSIRVDMERPSSVASRDLTAALYGDTPLGRSATLASFANISLDDVTAFHARTYRPAGAILVFAGDVTVDAARAHAEALLDGWATASPDAAPSPSPVSYAPKPAGGPRVVVVDNPDGKQATVRAGRLAYDIRTDEKFAGAIANRILSGGIDGRLMKYVRAERGLAYTAAAVFQPGRHGGEFVANVDTAVESAADAVRAMATVIDRMRTELVTDAELAEAKQRVAGGMLMQLQTIGQQAQFRVDGILNGYPIDYYDTYPQRIAQVTAEQVRDVMAKYATPSDLTVVVVAPATAVAEPLKAVGEVRVVPMPAKRPAAASQPTTREMLKPAA